MKMKKGFTLIELLVVIGILAILLAITLIAINPARQFGQANNTKRRSDILQVLNAIHQYAAENQGQLPPEVAALTASTPTLFNSTNFPNLCGQLMTNYLPALPTDPSLNTANITDCTTVGWNTGYDIAIDSAKRVTVSAPTTDNGATITVTR
ncbi:type II secretion system GspH family protein [Patescibacteria group bacterium]|nr:type II secretion system GspH family protein [Patescibacteria group bacterium]